MGSVFATELLYLKWINMSKFCMHGVLRSESTDATNQMDSLDWFNAQITNCRLGTHPKGGHSASSPKNMILVYLFATHHCMYIGI